MFYFAELFNTVGSKILNVQTAIKELEKFDADRWWELGRNLSLSSYHLQSIQNGNSGVGTSRDALMMVLRVWLTMDPAASWEKLADAVERCDKTTAENIRETWKKSSIGMYM